ncbi:MAG TPA: heme o synthase [Polyangiaceae bacterium]|nr:heme o synthase [Polyangiaceae bacterium]
MSIRAAENVRVAAAAAESPLLVAGEYSGGTPHSHAALERLRPWIELAKPGVTRLVLITTLFGGLVAPGHSSLTRWLLTLIGTVLVVAAANALNMAREADIDALMTRTRARPLPEGRLQVARVTKVAVCWALIGTAGLLAVNVATAALALLALVSYVWVYTPLKRITPHALYVGTLPGAIPPLIGYASVTGGRLDARALTLFALLAVWQVPHFLAIATFRRAEYARAGLPVFTVCRPRATVRRLTVAWSVALLAVSLLPIALGMGGTLYAALAVGFGLAFLFGAVYGLQSSADDRWARSLFFASMPHLVVLFVGLAL